jgi:hypothetical protein
MNFDRKTPKGLHKFLAKEKSGFPDPNYYGEYTAWTNARNKIQHFLKHGFESLPVIGWRGQWDPMSYGVLSATLITPKPKVMVTDVRSGKTWLQSMDDDLWS